MKTSIISITLVLIVFVSLSLSAKTEIPSCIQRMINGTPRLSPYIRIDNYLYNGKMVYLATSSCCDRFNPLFDGECNQICAPSGGFIGGGDRKCMDFDQTATKLANIWVVPRS